MRTYVCLLDGAHAVCVRECVRVCRENNNRKLSPFFLFACDIGGEGIFTSGEL